MAPIATARSSATRQAPARPASRRRRSAQTPIGGFVPVAVGRTAGAVGGLADSSLVVRLTRSRLWIGLLGALLVGIVALNVMALSFNASQSNAAAQAEVLERQNSALRAEVSRRLSNDEVQAAAAELGLITPAPGAIRYLRGSPQDAAEAARRLRAGELGAGAYVAAPAVVETVATPETPEAVAPVAEAETVPVAETLVPEETTAPAPETTAPAPDSAAPAGGVAIP